ncbi:hypothetical protein B566_EDAN014184 [Ephemera danica]|nr:hypothetical protein B566_EDAN014184 [Ephemera danica]
MRQASWLCATGRPPAPPNPEGRLPKDEDPPPNAPALEGPEGPPKGAASPALCPPAVAAELGGRLDDMRFETSIQ